MHIDYMTLAKHNRTKALRKLDSRKMRTVGGAAVDFALAASRKKRANAATSSAWGFAPQLQPVA